MLGKIRTNAAELRMLLDNLSRVKKGDQGLIARAKQKQLKRVAVEGDALEGLENRVEHGISRNCIFS